VAALVVPKVGLTATLLMALVWACGGSGTPSECVPGQSIACTGVGPCAGSQTCKADGSGYEACECIAGAQSDAGARLDSASVASDGAAADTERGGKSDAGAMPDSSAETLWFCGAVDDAQVCSCVHSTVAIDECAVPHPPCCFLFTGDAGIACECWPEGSLECNPESFNTPVGGCPPP
jgi:hypothetical protein